MVQPRALGQSRARAALPEAGPTIRYEWLGAAEWLEEQQLEAMMQRLSEGTRAGFDVGWRHWLLFCERQGRSPFLEGGSREQRTKDEGRLVTFAVFLARVLGKQTGTVKQKLFPVRYAHLVAGLDDPLLHRARLWATMAGLHRRLDSRKRKKPVTLRMLL